MEKAGIVISNELELGEVIGLAQNGDKGANNELIIRMMDNGYMKQVNKYLYTTHLLDPASVKSEFWFGVMKAIPRVRNDIGDPLQFLAYKGVKRVKSAMRMRLSKALYYQCASCNHKGKIKGNKFECEQCKEDNVELYQYEMIQSPDTMHYSSPRTKSLLYERMQLKEKVDILKAELSPRELEVYTLIVEQGFESTSCQNYLEEIGIVLDITPQCVLQYIKRIRQKYTMIGRSQ